MPRPLSIAIGLFMILGTLAALAWWWFRCARNNTDPARFVFKWIITALFTGMLAFFALRADSEFEKIALLPAVVLYGVAMSGLWAAQLGALVAKPFTSLFDGGDQEIEPQPLYSIAMGKRKAGKFQEAVYEVHKQLQRFPNDFQGLMMLAEIQAENLNDLAGAEVTIQRLINQPGHVPANIALALNELADWRLKYLQDAEAARQALEKIVELYPDSEQSNLAAQRIAHLVSTEALLAARERLPIHLEAGAQNVGLLKNSSDLRRPDQDPGAAAAQYVKQLEKHPLDNEAREKLALIYAEHYQRLDMAIEQLEHLIQQPHQPPKQIAHWLSLMADLQIKYSDDAEAPRQTLQRIIDLYPNLSHAENARQRLAYLKLHLKAKEEGQAIKLGTYEQNIGLKKR